ncbi:uncharacterized protein LOC126740901 [Anthonomus grandis grandis]|uniref:uncharacterized protein LOC126740901 n=1 Tax=Anthonomus grandis grandis TaxID=2921223 RepID=UPI00216654AE|nr:uncharacterized protein LOC126740901 [Anthonomus grandis grandis]
MSKEKATISNQTDGIEKNLNIESPIPSTSYQQNNENIFISPKEFQPPLRAAARKNTRKRRKAGRSLIATDTPEKDLLEMEQQGKRRIVPKKTKRVLMESSSSSSDTSLVLDSDNETSEDEALPDMADIDLADIKTILPKPHINGSTSRQNSYFKFNVNLGLLDVR